jgi:hypothetical protein
MISLVGRSVMCETLSALEDALGQFASDFDPKVLSGEEAAHAVRVTARIEKMVVTLKGLAAARAAETGAWKGSGARSAAAELARTTGTSNSAAAEALETA